MERLLKSINDAALMIQSRKADRAALATRLDQLQAALGEHDQAEAAHRALIEHRNRVLAEALFSGRSQDTTDVDKEIAQSAKEIAIAADEKNATAGAIAIVNDEIAKASDHLNEAESMHRLAAERLCKERFETADKAFERARAAIKVAVVQMAAASAAAMPFGGIEGRSRMQDVLALVSGLFTGDDRWILDIDQTAELLAKEIADEIRAATEASFAVSGT